MSWTLGSFCQGGCSAADAGRHWDGGKHLAVCVVRTTVVRFGTGELRYRLHCQKTNIVKNIIIWVGLPPMYLLHFPAARHCFPALGVTAQTQRGNASLR